jgi:chaperonin GroES
LLPEEELVNGLFIPDTAKEKPQEGLVIAVGQGSVKNGIRVPVDVQVGQRVLFGKYSGNDVSIDNEPLLLLREEEIQACFED